MSRLLHLLVGFLAVAVVGGLLGWGAWGLCHQRDEARQARQAQTPLPPPITTETPISQPEPASPLRGVRILLDPGHSGGLVGATRQVPDGRGGFKDCNNSGTASNAGFPEHTFNWEVATRLKALLEDEGASVDLTRADDVSMGPCVDERGKMASGYDAAVSIHANGTPNPAVKGYFALVSSPALTPAQGEPSQTLARHLLTGLGYAGFSPSTAVAGQISYRADLAGLNFAECPTVMMELGEMRNGEEAALMQTPEGQQRYAEALADGLRRWASER
ncbi:N-acetylmuramoyl-L-alanine amidase [Nanchangia anserum]|uniref:N-acetylmuramoyl-L-alanine amidase n=1 Tax=Nanchangia anserum TaxID=2692125 RepID=A0A8I0GAV5_9ACTO|nr:N-acetylmuramoyl-L-alanine amidase [Nanchangia anserum]MBD3688876.1 N-acetylmuramoyl-L-alanine amidase [Nanchangia anserum]QOX81143.1 N-acetylmuramoyl-L-alanine amidase [Nanchangia anserum]